MMTFLVGWSPGVGVLPPTPGQGTSFNAGDGDDSNATGDIDDDYDSVGDDSVDSCNKLIIPTCREGASGGRGGSQGPGPGSNHSHFQQLSWTA